MYTLVIDYQIISTCIYIQCACVNGHILLLLLLLLLYINAV